MIEYAYENALTLFKDQGADGFDVKWPNEAMPGLKYYKDIQRMVRICPKIILTGLSEKGKPRIVWCYPTSLDLYRIILPDGTEKRSIPLML